ncbi:hypothetical protein QCA50_013188 [Cerrena zonata]|uniref:Uncharacterized protein n=1 Tax=Cerrena zonata TaxID=2478898 RepID=A0AAW0FUL7_9APHY
MTEMTVCVGAYVPIVLDLGFNLRPLGSGVTSQIEPVRVLRYHQIIKATRPIISSFHHLELAQTPGFSRLFLECPPVAAAPQSREHLKIESFHGCNHLWITISARFRDHSSCRYPHLCIPPPSSPLPSLFFDHH